ncbi:MAG TPA: HPF/RaiA family ribosome-associated protein [Acidobacteriaceae bacterium]|nr:HPF/RaiA family ribosome-associated protein [Acidobacteriaceae bacterium]
MDSELTGRNVKVTKDLRAMADESLDRIGKLVGRGASARIIFRSQKHLSIAEVTVIARQHTVVGVAEGPDLTIALRTALEKTEKQAIRWRKSKVEKKRQAKPISAVLPAIPTEAIDLEEAAEVARRNGNAASPGKRKPSGVHIVPAPEAMALRPMTIEEAVKEAEAGDRPVFVFRDLAGDLKVLHCAGDGLVRLTEVS